MKNIPRHLRAVSSEVWAVSHRHQRASEDRHGNYGKKKLTGSIFCSLDDTFAETWFWDKQLVEVEEASDLKTLDISRYHGSMTG